MSDVLSPKKESASDKLHTKPTMTETREVIPPTNENSVLMRMDEAIEESQCIGSIGSHFSTDQLLVNLNNEASKLNLKGKMLLFQLDQDSKPTYVISQINSIMGKNPALDEYGIKSIIKNKETIDNISGSLDVNEAIINPKSAFSLIRNDSYQLQQTILGSVPTTDTRVYLVNDQILDNLFLRYKERLYYIGYSYLSDTKVPLILKHFGDGIHGMGNDGYHTLVAAKTGGGKSTIAKMLSIGYAKYKNMAQLIIDPVGELSKNARGYYGTERFQLNLKLYYESFGRKVNVYGIRDLVFDTWELFEVVLSKSDFFKELTIKKKENREEACRIIETELRSNKYTLSSLWKAATFEMVMRLLDDEDTQRHIFGSDKPLRRLRDILSRIDRQDLYNRYWMPIMRLFNEDEQTTEIKGTAKKRRITIRDLMAEMFEITRENIENRPITFVDLSSSSNVPDTYWDEDIEQTIVKRLFQAIYQTAVQRYEISKSLNCLVILDEAHRFANKELHEDDDSIVVLLRRYVRETRKFGVGWMFITTSLADMDRAIVDQTGVRIFGYGLSMGPELARLKECVTDPSDIDFYLTFPHPLNALEDDQRIYSYMITGPISPLSNNYSPIFISAFKTPEDYSTANNLKFR